MNNISALDTDTHTATTRQTATRKKLYSPKIIADCFELWLIFKSVHDFQCLQRVATAIPFLLLAGCCFQFSRAIVGSISQQKSSLKCFLCSLRFVFACSALFNRIPNEISIVYKFYIIFMAFGPDVSGWSVLSVKDTIYDCHYAKALIMAAIKGLFTNFLLCCLFFYPKTTNCHVFGNF